MSAERRLGAFCFRHRSTLPLLLLPLVAAAVLTGGPAAAGNAPVWNAICLAISL